MIIFGLSVSIFCLLYRKKTDFEKSIVWLALLSFFRGSWTLIESNVYSFFFARLLLISQLSYIVLKISTVAFMEFVNLSFHKGKSKTIKVLIVLEYIDFWVSVFCQYVLGIDFAYTVYATHVILLVCGVYTCISSILAFKKNVSNDSILNKSSYAAHVLGSLAIVIASFIDLLRYNYFRSPDVARFSRWGDFIYISLVSITLFANFVSLLKMGHNAEQLKEAATIDPLTKLLNRSSFERDINSGTQLQWISMGIVMLDLNNLKHFNDVHGHGMGDYYIIISSEIICDAFSKYGTVYRIGGDEFCVIVRDLSMENFISVRTNIEEYMSALKMPSSDLHMGISAGYAEFNANIDLNLRDTMKRADEYMYQRKMELKKQNHRE
jgi:diguanylate cyclase (GGDEF)-like protein